MFQRIGLNRNLAIISATIFTNLFVRFGYFAVLPLHLRTLGATDFEISTAFTAMMLARSVFSIIGGALGDAVGRKATIALGTFAMGPFYVLAGLSQDWFFTCAMLVIVEMFGALQWPPLSAFIMESSDENRVARSYSFTEAAVLIGSTLGPLAGAAILTIIGVPAMIIFNGVVLMINGIVRAMGLRETPARRAGIGLPKLASAITPNLAWFVFLGTLTVAGFGIAYGPFFAILARDAWHNTDAEINLLWAFGSLASLAGILLGRLSDHWGAKRIFILAAIGFGITTILWGIAPTWEWGLLPLLGSFFFSEAIFMAQQTIQASITTPRTRSSMIGLLNTLTGITGGMGPLFGGWLIAVGGNPLPFIAAGVMGLVTIFAVTRIQAVKEN